MTSVKLSPTSNHFKLSRYARLAVFGRFKHGSNALDKFSPKTKTSDRVEFLRKDTYGYWWSPTEDLEYNHPKGYSVYCSSRQPLELNSGLFFMEKGNGLSVRCRRS